MNKITINVKAKDLYKYVASLADDPEAEGLKIQIYEQTDEEGNTQKFFSIDILECGGLGLICNDVDPLREMSPEELDEIP